MSTNAMPRQEAATMHLYTHAPPLARTAPPSVLTAAPPAGREWAAECVRPAGRAA